MKIGMRTPSPMKSIKARKEKKNEYCSKKQRIQCLH